MAKKNAPKKTPAKKGRDTNQRVTVTKPGDREEVVGGSTLSNEVTGHPPAPEIGNNDRDYQEPPTHQPDVSVEPGLDPRTPPNAN